jgi:hypothetical protein
MDICARRIAAWPRRIAEIAAETGCLTATIRSAVLLE